MSQLGCATNSKKQWALPMEPDTLGPGSVVMANPGSFDHYFLESLVLILEHGEGGTRGVLLNHETPWRVEDLSQGAIEPFAANTVFLGGDAGRDTMVMIHGEPYLPGAEEVGRGVYQGGVSAAVDAVREQALPPDRFKFFYKSVEWLPFALSMQIDSGIFRLVELSPGWLFGQSGQRNMWKQVREMLRQEEVEAARAAGLPPPSEDDEEAPGANAPGEATGLPYEAGGLAEAAGRAAAEMRRKKQEVAAATEAVKKEADAQSDEALRSHDAKVKAFVEQIKLENAATAAAEKAT